MTEDHEHDDDPEAVGAPLTGDALADDEQDAEEAEEAEAADGEVSEAAAPQGTTPEEWEERFKYAERLAKPYTKKVEAKWAEDAVYLVRWNIDEGAPLGYIDTRNMGRASDETKEAALAFLGLTGAENVQKDPFSRECDTCGGWGRCATGSKVPNMETLPCLPCGGLGWLPTGPERSRDTPPAAAVNGATEGAFVPAAVGPESPEVAQLRQLGYTVIPPMQGVS